MPESPMRALLAVATALLGACAALADEAALKQVAALEFPRGERVSYVELQSNRLLRTPQRQHGWMWIEHDGTLVMRVVQPLLEERRMSQGELTLRRPQSGSVHTSPDEAIAKAPLRRTALRPERGAHATLIAIADVLLARADALEQTFAVASARAQDDSGAEGWEVVLTPLDPGLRRELRSIRLYGRGTELTGLRAERGEKTWRHLEMSPPMVEGEPQPSS